MKKTRNSKVEVEDMEGLEELEELEVLTSVETKEVDKQKALKVLESQLIKDHGDNYYAITQKRRLEPINFITTGCYTLDKVLGGGIPEGRVITVYGEPSVGKSLFALSCVKAFQSQNKLCAYIDVEHSLSSDFMQICGIDTENIAIAKGNTAEENLDILRKIVKSNVIDLVVLDSVASLSSQQMQEKDAEENGMANEARLLSRILKELVIYAEKNKCTIILINQTRLNLGGYVVNKIMPGGQSIKFFSSIILKLAKKENIKYKSEVVGVTVEASTDKNKVGTPFKSGMFNILFPHEDINGEIVAGIDTLTDLVQGCVDNNIVVKAGAWISLVYEGEELKYQGLDNFKESIKERPEIINYLTDRLYNLTK